MSALRQNRLSRWTRLTLVVAAAAVYALAFVPLHQIVGDQIFALSLVPVVAAGWLLGLWAGALVSAIAFPVNMLLLSIVGGTGWHLAIGVLNSIALVLVGVATGRLRDLQARAVQRMAARLDAEAALRDSEEKYRALFEASSDAIFLETIEGRVLDCNAAACAMYGYAKDELIGMTVSDLVPDEVVVILPDVIDEEVTTGSVFLEALNRRRDGEVFPIELSTRLVTVGGEQRILAYVRDITERKRAEEDLRESRLKYVDLYENANDMIFTLDLEGRFTSANRVAYSAMGYTEEEIIGRNLLDILTPESASFASQLLRAVVGQQSDLVELQPWELEAITGGGDTRVVEVRARLMWDGDEIVGYHGIARDITDRKQSEEWLKARERFMEAISEVSQRLLAADDLDQVLPDVLQRLGETARVDRSYLFEHRPGEGGGLPGYPRSEWRAPSPAPQSDGFDEGRPSYAAESFSRWRDLMEKGGVVAGPVSAFPDGERETLIARGVGSVLAIPVFVHDAWYGFVGLDTRDPVREWQRIDIDLLRAAAGAISTAIEREFAARQSKALAEAATALASTLDLEEVLDRILEQVNRVAPSDASNIMFIEDGQARVVRASGYERFGAEEFVASLVFNVREIPCLRQMVETGEPTVVSSTQECPTWIELPAQHWLRSYAGVPIYVRGEVIGILNVDSAIPGFFTRAHLGALRAFAGQAAVAIQNARLFAAVNRRVAELEALRQVSLGLTSRLELGAVLDAILDSTLGLLDEVQNAHVFLYSDELLEFGAALWYDGRRGQAIAEPRPEGLTYSVARKGEMIVVPDFATHPLFVGAPPEWHGAIVGLPLKIGARVVGVMNVSYRHPRTFSEAELRVLRLLADQAAIATENARLFQSEQRQTRRLALLADIARIVATARDVDDLLQAVADSIQRQFAYPMVEILTLNDEGTTLLLRGYSGLAIGSSGLITPGVYRQAVEEGIIGLVARSAEPYCARDVRVDPYFLSVGETSIRSELCVPVLDEGLVVGAVDVESDRVADFDDEDRSLLEAVADAVAIGLRNARLYEETQRRVRELTILNRVSVGFGTAMDADDLIESALDGLQELVGADRTTFISADLDVQTWTVTHARVGPGIVSGIGQSGSFDDVPAELERILAGKALVISDVFTDPGIGSVRKVIQPLGTRSFLLVPVLARGRLYGALGFSHCRERHAWLPEEVRLMEAVAHQLELALENVHLFEEARLRAEELATALAKLEALDRLKDEFIQNVSHELRSPLALIRGYAEMLDAGDLGTLQNEQQKPVAIIARRARMLGDLVRDITLILEAEVSPPGVEPVCLEELARAAVEDFHITAEQEDLTLEIEIAPELPPVRSSNPYLRRVLDNLLGNAVKFTPEGGVISVRARQEGECVLLTVSDTGIGIPEDQLAHVFERFYQVDGSSRRRYGGVGLGLALVRELVETYGGTVGVESHLGQGTMFSVRLLTALEDGAGSESIGSEP
jgi:PAS domain S-box-containing protein